MALEASRDFWIAESAKLTSVPGGSVKWSHALDDVKRPGAKLPLPGLLIPLASEMPTIERLIGC